MPLVLVYVPFLIDVTIRAPTFNFGYLSDGGM
jgi:hypothetical protein